jgi:transposase
MQLKNTDISRALAFLETGMTQSEVAEKLGVNQSTISRIVKRYQKTGLLSHLCGNGRHRVADEIVTSLIKKKIKENAKTSLRKLAEKIRTEAGVDISKSTIKNVLNHHNLFAFSPIKKPLLKPHHINQRYLCAEQWLRLSKEELKTIIFSDESKFNLFYSDGKVSVWREPGTGLDPRHIAPTIKHGGASVMVWACFSYYGTGNLVFIDGNMDAVMYVEILSDNLAASAQKMGLSEYIFQQDNDPKYTAKLTTRFLDGKGIKTLPWPAQSPDMNPIENLWGLIKAKIGEKCPRNINELKQVILEEWNNIGPKMCQKYAESFRKRTKELLKARGGHTCH